MAQSSDELFIDVSHVGGTHDEELMLELVAFPEVYMVSTKEHGRRLMVSTLTPVDRAEEAVQRLTAIVRTVLLARGISSGSLEVSTAPAQGFAAA